MKLGIVGLPNVGKSTLFNSLTKAGAESANYPFCTIDPNVGIVPVPDKRLQQLGDFYQSKKVTPAVIEFVDIAGLVKGASKGEGLGNQFLANIREVDAIVHVVRCFEDPNVIHVDGSIDPLRDIETIDLELIFADLEVLERRISKTAKSARMDKEAAKELEFQEQKRRVSYAVFPKDYPYAEVFARCGVLPPPEKPLRMAKAAEIIRRAMARLGLAPERARIALCAPSQSAALEAAARELSKDVRYLALCAPNGERLARTLRWDCGASVHTLQTDERIAADLSVCFDDFPLPDGLVLPLGSGAVSVAYGTENLGDAAMIWNEDQLICALYASLARRADEIWVKDVKMPPDGGENANLP